MGVLDLRWLVIVSGLLALLFWWLSGKTIGGDNLGWQKIVINGLTISVPTFIVSTIWLLIQLLIQ